MRMTAIHIWVILQVTLLRILPLKLSALSAEMNMTPSVSDPRITPTSLADYQDIRINQTNNRDGKTTETIPSTESDTSDMVKVCFFVNRSEMEQSTKFNSDIETVTGSTRPITPTLYTYELDSSSQSPGISSTFKDGENITTASLVGINKSAASHTTSESGMPPVHKSKTPLIATAVVGTVMSLAISYVLFGPFIRRKFFKKTREQIAQQKESEKINWVGGNNVGERTVRFSSLRDKSQGNSSSTDTSTSGMQTLGSTEKPNHISPAHALNDATCVDIEAERAEQPPSDIPVDSDSVSLDIELFSSEIEDSSHVNDVETVNDSNDKIYVQQPLASFQSQGNGDIPEWPTTRSQT